MEIPLLTALGVFVVITGCNPEMDRNNGDAEPSPSQSPFT